jgi:hypothetical protein
MGFDHWVFYYEKTVKINLGLYDDKKRYAAEISDKYSDLIFCEEIVMVSYLKKKQYSFRVIVDCDRYPCDFKKFDGLQAKDIRIVHAPTDYLKKGTPLVRAAIKKLREEGYQFYYRELSGVPNTEVIKSLEESHIVLNQFYSFFPALFGLEGLATGNAVLMNADPTLNNNIFLEADQAWVITHYWQIYDNLKYLLEHPLKIKIFAQNGRKYVEQYHSFENAFHFYNNVFKKEQII